ncbi:MAG: tripartite tricarboxylate transporter TctB family protein [Clostridiaceae bacterium]|jgi:hypothetical protein|nr:tripartite tricarboxylate transporter TctB family protein [Clostridiaceae bacterium]
MKRIIHHDVYFSITAILFSIFMLAITLQLPDAAAKYPFVILLILTVLSIAELIQAVKGSVCIKPETANEAQYIKWHIIKTPLISTIFVLAYAVCMDFLGFFSSTVIFLVSFMYYCGVRSWKKIMICVIGLNLFIYFVFVVQLKVQFPNGLIF